MIHLAGEVQAEHFVGAPSPHRRCHVVRRDLERMLDMPLGLFSTTSALKLSRERRPEPSLLRRLLLC
jgi:hypothetical protein